MTGGDEHPSVRSDSTLGVGHCAEARSKPMAVSQPDGNLEPTPAQDVPPVASPLKRRREGKPVVNQAAVLAELWKLYKEVILPVERRSHFEHFHAPPVTQPEFTARPQVLLLGQYSTGKTSMIQWFAGSRSSNFDIRPQPSTDKFMAVVHGEREQVISGNAAACLPQLPYQGLSTFGARFLQNFQALALPADALEDISFIDSPGILSGHKQHRDRNYTFTSVAAWMAERADLVFLTFDAHKLDISDEFKEVMEVLRPHSDKVRCMLNKADQIDANNLVRVYGALLWNVGKILQTPEITRVFVSSFWDQPYRYKDHEDLFNEDKGAVLKEIEMLPLTSVSRKINMLVARVRRVRAHLCIVAHVKSQLPWFLVNGKAKRLEWVKDNLPRLVEETQRLRRISPGDVPAMQDMVSKFESFEDPSSLPAWKQREFDSLNRLLDVDIPRIMETVSGISSSSMNTDTKDGSHALTKRMRLA